MLTIRLTRKGKKNQPFFKVVVIDKKRSSKGGREVEVSGYIDPLTKKRSLKKERVLYWISKGAKPSDTMNNLLIQEKIIEGEKIHVSRISKKRQAVIDAEKAKAVPASPTEAPKSEGVAPTPDPVAVEAPVAPASTQSSSEAKEEKLIEEPKEGTKPAEEKDEQK